MPATTPLALLKLPKPIASMTEEELHAFAAKMVAAMAKARVPAKKRKGSRDGSER